MNAAALKQDYWPGYLDALVNVMLYLLLLVGSFALGMVALTLYSMQQQQQLSFLGARSEQLVEQMSLSEGEKAEMSARLASLDIEAIVLRREQLDRERQLEEARLAQQRLQQQQERREQQQAIQLRRAASTTDTKQESDAALQAALEAQKADMSKRLAAMDLEYNELLALLEKDRRQLAQTRQSEPAKPVELVTDVRVVNRGPGSTTGVPSAAGGLFNTVPRSVWAFDASQFIWAADRPLPADFSDADRASGWSLVIHADTGNSRITRESFARVNSVREALVQQGFTRERIKVEVRSIDGVSVKDERLFRTVYMLEDN